MNRLLNKRSIRAAIARGERRLAVLDAKRTELVRSIAELWDMLPQRFPLMSQETFRRKVLGDTPDTHEQPRVVLTSRGDDDTVLHMTDLDGTMSSWKKMPDLAVPPQATDAQQASDTAAMLPEAERPVADTHEWPAVSVGGGIPPGMVLPETTTTVANTGDDPPVPQATNAEQASGTAAPLAEAPRKPGWPPGLSRKLTVCENSPKWPAHRHRTEGTEVHCVGSYPETAAAP